MSEIENKSLAVDCGQVLKEHVEQLLAQREVLAPALAAFAEEMPPGRARHDMRKLVQQLNQGASAELIVQRTKPSILLPLLGNHAMQGAHRSLHSLLTESALKNRARSERVRSYTYPLIVFLLAMGVLVFLGLAVVPTFIDIFNDFGLDLPLLSQGLVIFSNELLRHPFRLLGLVTAVVVFVYLIIYTIRFLVLPGRLMGDLTSGNSGQVSALANFTRALAEALGAGFPLSCALQLAGRCSNLRWLEHEAESLALSASSEGYLSDAALRRAHLPTMVVHALKAGPSSAPSLALLREVSEIYSERVRNRLDWSTGFVPQFTILLVGIVVGVVVIALYLPLVSLINGLTG